MKICIAALILVPTLTFASSNSNGPVKTHNSAKTGPIHNSVKTGPVKAFGGSAKTGPIHNSAKTGPIHNSVKTGPVSAKTGPVKAFGGSAKTGPVKVDSANYVKNSVDSRSTSSVSNENNFEGDESFAPSIGLVAPQSTDSVRCIGVGGSNVKGSVLLGKCWKARDDWAVSRFERLRSLRLYEEAAKAYCSRPFHYRDFESQADCENKVAQSISPKKVARPASVVAPVAAPAKPSAEVLQLRQQIQEQQTEFNEVQAKLKNIQFVEIK